MCVCDCGFGTATGGYPFILKLSSTGEGWRGEHILRGNQNTQTGWEGSWGDGPAGDGWSWGGGALSFTVAPGVGGKPHRLAFTDDGFIHGSFDGGARARVCICVRPCSACISFSLTLCVPVGRSDVEGALRLAVAAESTGCHHSCATELGRQRHHGSEYGLHTA